MRQALKSYLLRILLVLAVLAASGLAQSGTQYVLTNDDLAFPFLTGVSFFSVGTNGLPSYLQQVQTGTFGVGGGYFGMSRLAVLNSNSQQCVFATEARNGYVVGVAISTLAVGGSTPGSSTDSGSTNGVGLAVNSNYLYASYSTSNTIGTFAVQPGCTTTFVGDTSVGGVLSGFINGMALHGNLLLATYSDGSIESFDVSGGTPVSNGDKQFSTAYVASQGASYANGIDITSDGHYAVFGDTSTSLAVEVADISSGKLTRTRVYKSPAGISSTDVLLSPDESILYVVNTQGASVSALFFNKTTGKLTPGCTSPPLAGLSQNWSYLGSPALISQTGNGGGVYVAEFGAVSGIAMVTLTPSGQKCVLQEAAGSPVVDPNTPGLLSIGTFPPRSF
jgi:6-phosphogluconolactonase (cycloisomerase 2 family)